MSNLLSERQVADMLGIKPGTLNQWRVRRSGPVYVKVCRSVRYRLEDVEAWIAANRIAPVEG